VAGDSDFDAEWDAALADAEIRTECARCWVMERLGAEGGAKALWWPPGEEIPRGDEFPDADMCAQANTPQNVDLHRVALRPHAHVATLAARVRH